MIMLRPTSFLALTLTAAVVVGFMRPAAGGQVEASASGDQPRTVILELFDGSAPGQAVG